MEVPGDDSDDEVCSLSIREIFPEMESTSVYYRSAVEVTFSEPGDVEPIRVTRFDGARIGGVEQWSEDGTRLTFTPSAPLEPDTAYAVELAYGCDRTARWEWTTSATGGSVDLAQVDGAVYALVPADGR